MLEWEFLEAHDMGLAKTPLVYMSVCIDASRLPDQSYQAQVRSLNYTQLASADNLPTVEAARNWCVTTYATLLQIELTAVVTPTLS